MNWDLLWGLIWLFAMAWAAFTLLLAAVRALGKAWRNE